MKSDQTTNVLLGIIATGVAALTALAFEKRYYRSFRHAGEELDDSLDHAYDRISHSTHEAGRAVKEKASSLRDRFEDGVETLKEKAGQLKDRVSHSLDRAGSHLRDGAEKLKDGIKDGAEEVKEGAEAAGDEARRAFDNPNA
jgi:gas vesicle protein